MKNKITETDSGITASRRQLLGQIPIPLLYWYATNRRKLPWREEITPYRTWISEIMLQQTRVEAVIPYFSAFIETFPTVYDLANADTIVLQKKWQGLGYYSRALNLKKAAEVIVRQYDGQIPSCYDTLLTLPGIGAYTAGAISSIAYGKPTPAIDGNVLRVITRLCADDTRIDNEHWKKSLFTALAEIYPKGQCSEMTQALMELGATVCIPNGAARCHACPLADICAAHADSSQANFPVKPPKKERKIENRTVLLIMYHDKVAIRQRPAKGLLASLWEFPSLDGHADEQEVRLFLKEQGMTVKNVTRGQDSTHIFTHVEWHMISYRVELKEENGVTVFATTEELKEKYPIPSAFQRYRGYEA